MDNDNVENQYKKLVDLGDGKSVYQIGLNLLREQDVNARIMDIDVFDRLTDNIKKYGMESMPLVYKMTNPAGNLEFYIISGHHRIRAARAAMLKEIPCLVYEKELTQDEIISKQLSHNAINGFDDKQILSKLYNMISDIDYKIETGIKDAELLDSLNNIKIDEINIDMDYQLVNILFLPRNFERFKEVLLKIEPEAELYLADKVDWDKFKGICQDIAKREHIINMAAIMTKMIDILEEYYIKKNNK